jgi:hypothetical protein
MHSSRAAPDEVQLSQRAQTGHVRFTIDGARASKPFRDPVLEFIGSVSDWKEEDLAKKFVVIMQMAIVHCILAEMHFTHCLPASHSVVQFTQL